MCAACPGSVRLLPFCSPFALRWRGGPSSQLPSRYLLTLKRKISKVQEQDGNSLLPSLTFRTGLWETEAFQAPIAAYCTPPPPPPAQGIGLEWALGWLPPSKRALACLLLSPRGGWRGDRMASPKDLGCRIACWDPAPTRPPPHPSPSSGPLRLKGELCCP